MRVEAECGPLVAAVSAAAKVVMPRAVKPQLLCVKLTAVGDTLTVEATDLEAAVRVTTAATGDPGETCVEAARLANILSGIGEGPLSLELVKGDKLRIKAGGDKWDLPTQDPAEFPGIADDDLEDRNWLTLPGEELARLLSLTLWAAEAKENAKYTVTAVLVEITPDEIAAVATDSKGLAVATFAPSPRPEFAAAGLLPPKAVKLTLSSVPSGPVQLSVGKSDAVVRSEGYLMRTRLVEGRFVPWRSIVPKAALPTRVPFDPAALAAAVRKAVATGDKLESCCQFAFTPGQVVLSAASEKGGESEVVLALPGSQAAHVVTFDPEYVVDVCARLKGHANAAWEFSKVNQPSVFRGERFSFLLMPMAE